MPSIIPCGRAVDNADGILHLPDAFERSLTDKFVLYCRASSWNAPQRKSLADQIAIGHRRINEIAGPGKLKALSYGVEPGQISAKRPKLISALHHGARHKAIVVARDVSRFIRSESYDRRTNRDVSPTPEEMGRLLELAREYGIILATLEDPTLTESERHSLATKASGKAGRPSTIDYKLAIAILEFAEWRESLSFIAKRLRITKSKVQRLLDQEIPEYVLACQGVPRTRPDGGRWRWKDLEWPARACRIAHKLSERQRSDGGVDVSKPR